MNNSIENLKCNNYCTSFNKAIITSFKYYVAIRDTTQ